MSDEKWYPAVGDGGQIVARFKFMKKLNVPESQQADEHRYRQVVVLEHKSVASVDVSTTPVKPWNERELRAKHPLAWAAFQGEEPKIEGTPITDLTALNEDQIMMLKINGIYVIEQLAELSDARCQQMGFGWRMIRNKSQEFLKAQIERYAREDRIERERVRAEQEADPKVEAA